MDHRQAGAEVAQVTVVRDDEAARYEGRLGDELVATVDYVLRGDTVLITHTGTNARWRGRGIAARVTTWALEDIRSRGGHVSPLCPYTAHFMDTHPGYEDLLS
jgi:predicted GNAT family acetyltransferase